MAYNYNLRKTTKVKRSKTKEKVQKVLELLSIRNVSLREAVSACYKNYNSQSLTLFNRDVFPRIEPVVTKEYKTELNLTRKGKKILKELSSDDKLDKISKYMKYPNIPFTPSIHLKKSKKEKILMLDSHKIVQMWLDRQIFLNSEKHKYEMRDDNVIVSAMFGSSPREQKIIKVLNDLSKNELFLNHLFWYFGARIGGENIPNFNKILGEDYIGLLQLREVSDFIDKKLRTSETKKKVFLTLLKRYPNLVKNHRIKLAIDLEKLSYNSIDAMKTSLI